MAHRDGSGRPSRDPRLHRQYSGYGAGPEGRGGRTGAGMRGGFDGGASHPPHSASHRSHPPHPQSSYRHYGADAGGSVGGHPREGLMRREQFDYGHKRERSRSPLALRDSDYGSKHCDINTLLRDESIQITVGNDKFKNSQHSTSGAHSSSATQNSVSAIGRSSGGQEHQEYAEETASVARAKEMAMRTREMLSKLTGWNPISLQPTSVKNADRSGDGPALVNVSNSAYTKLSASSDVAQTILRNINAVAAAFCPKESGGVTHIKYVNPVTSKKVINEDEDRFLYGEELVPDNLKKQFGGQGGSSTKSVFGDLMLPSAAEPPSVKKRETESDCDPVVANVLKSIGFNFELSKIMQEKAKKEREENEKNRLLIQQASSFLAKRLGKTSALETLTESLNSLGNMTRVVVNKDAEPSRNLATASKERRNDLEVLYDDFSNSEDEFCDSEKKTKVVASLSDSSPQPPVASSWSNSSLVGTVPPTLNFQPLPVSVLPTPTVNHPTVPPPPITIPPPHILLPPVLQPQMPVWPTYQMPIVSTPPNIRTGSQPCPGVEWEQNTEDFLRKLQEPRGADASSKKEAKTVPRSSSPSSSDSEKAVKRNRTPAKPSKRNAARENSKSPEWSKRRKYTNRNSDDQFKSDVSNREKDSDLQRLKSLRDKLQSLKKEHSSLTSMRTKSTYIRDKIARNMRLQRKLGFEIDSLRSVVRGARRYEETASGDEHPPERARPRRDSRGISPSRSNRRSRELSRDRDRKVSRNRELGHDRDQDSRSSRPRTIRRSSERQQKSDAGAEHEKKSQPNVGADVRDEKIEKCSKSEVDAEVKEEGGNLRKEDELKRETDGNVMKKEPEDAATVVKTEPQKTKKIKMRYDYYDGGDSWCSLCNESFTKLSEFLNHLHCQTHEKHASHLQNDIKRPWTSNQSSQTKPHNSVPPVSVPASGMEFLKPTRGFFCTLCHQFTGDSEDAEVHVLSEEHNNKFKEHCSVNTSYLHNYNIIKVAKMSIKLEKTSLVAAYDGVPNSPSEATSELKAKAAVRVEHLAGKKGGISAKPLSNVVVGKFPHLRRQKELNLSETGVSTDESEPAKKNLGSSKWETNSDVSSCDEREPSDADRLTLTLSAAESRTSGNERLMDSVNSDGDEKTVDYQGVVSPCLDVDMETATSSQGARNSLEDIPGREIIQVNPQDTVEAAGNVTFVNGASCSLVPYDEPEEEQRSAGDEQPSISSEVSMEEEQSGAACDGVSTEAAAAESVLDTTCKNGEFIVVCPIDDLPSSSVKEKEEVATSLECTDAGVADSQAGESLHETVDGCESVGPLALEESRHSSSVDFPLTDLSPAVELVGDPSLSLELADDGREGLQAMEVSLSENVSLSEIEVCQFVKPSDGCTAAPPTENGISGGSQTLDPISEIHGDTVKVASSSTEMIGLSATTDGSSLKNETSVAEGSALLEPSVNEEIEVCHSVKPSVIEDVRDFDLGLKENSQSEERSEYENTPCITDDSVQLHSLPTICDVALERIDSDGKAVTDLAKASVENEVSEDIKEARSVRSEATDDYDILLDDEDVPETRLETNSSVAETDNCTEVCETVVKSETISESVDGCPLVPVVDVASVDNACESNRSSDFCVAQSESETKSLTDGGHELLRTDESKSDAAADEILSQLPVDGEDTQKADKCD